MCIIEELFAKYNNLHFQDNVSEVHVTDIPPWQYYPFSIISRQIRGKWYLIIILIYIFLTTWEFEYYSSAYFKIQILGFNHSLHFCSTPQHFPSLSLKNKPLMVSSAISSPTCLWEAFLNSSAAIRPRVRPRDWFKLPRKI